jgi:curved DNA-binding protein CbpA
MAGFNAFEILGMEPCLTIDEEALRGAFREAGRTAHPDAGGGDDAFARLREAFEIVSSPSRRLKHWLDQRGTPAETRGTVDPALMDLFSEVGAATQQAESLIRKRDETKSALGLAMLERETHTCREAVEKALRLVESAISRECSVFPEIEAATVPDVDAPSKTARNLAFLEKWRGGLRGVFSRLV